MNELKFPDEIMGVIIAVGFIVGFVMYSLAVNIIRLFRGTFPTLLICCLLNVVRFASYSYSESPYVFLLVQLFHPFMYGVPIVAAMQHIKVISSEKVTTSIYEVLEAHFLESTEC